MSDSKASRFTPQNKATHERLSTNTVGLVALSDFRKRRAEALEQQEREAREAAFGPSNGGRSGTATGTSNTPAEGTPDPDDGEDALVKQKPKKAKKGKKLLSFDDDEEADVGADGGEGSGRRKKEAGLNDGELKAKKSELKPNIAIGIIPKSLTKAALRKEAAEREALRREFLDVQEAVKATEIAIPFVFYDGLSIPGGTVRVKKGDFTWVFLDKSRKMGARMGPGKGKAATRKQWARIGVDDLMLVRRSVIIPHHYDFYYFALNKSIGPGGEQIFGYSNEPPSQPVASGATLVDPLITAKTKLDASSALPDITTLEGANDDPMLTKVVDRRWYERNKHIYPASTWQEFDPEKDYSAEVRKDGGGNTFFFSK